MLGYLHQVSAYTGTHSTLWESLLSRNQPVLGVRQPHYLFWRCASFSHVITLVRRGLRGSTTWYARTLV